jgi:hypothetical protein
MFNRQIYIEDNGVIQFMKLDYKDVIFVFEDVDAQSSVVIDRKLKEVAKEVYEIDPPKNPVVDDDDGGPSGGFGSFGNPGFGNFGGFSSQKAPKKPVEVTEKSEKELKSRSPEEISNILATLNADNDDTKKKLEMYKKWFRNARDNIGDELDLSGLLNVLDGILETPGRIVIMTSNYPELLDSALLRPGRIDRHEILSYITADCSIQLIEHCFNTKLNSIERNRIISIINNADEVKFTPAELESKCADHSSLNDLMKELEELVHKISDEKDAKITMFENTTTTTTDNDDDDGRPIFKRSVSAPMRSFSAPYDTKHVKLEESTEALIRMQSWSKKSSNGT